MTRMVSSCLAQEMRVTEWVLKRATVLWISHRADRSVNRCFLLHQTPDERKSHQNELIAIATNEVRGFESQAPEDDVVSHSKNQSPNSEYPRAFLGCPSTEGPSQLDDSHEGSGRSLSQSGCEDLPVSSCSRGEAWVSPAAKVLEPGRPGRISIASPGSHKDKERSIKQEGSSPSSASSPVRSVSVLSTVPLISRQGQRCQ